MNPLRSTGVIAFLVAATPLVHHTQQHHHLPAQGADLVGLAVGSFASWVGVPGPGEPLLIAAAVLAARGKLSIGLVLGTAFGGAMMGALVGWIAGIKGGRALMMRPGPLLRLRLRALRRGEEVFHRAPALSVFLAPSWISGFHHIQMAIYIPMQALSAACWTLGIGLSAYFVGPAVVDLVTDAGTVLAAALAVLVVVGLVLGALARRRGHHGRPLPCDDATADAAATGTSAPSPGADTAPPADPR